MNNIPNTFRQIIFYELVNKIEIQIKKTIFYNHPMLNLMWNEIDTELSSADIFPEHQWIPHF